MDSISFLRKVLPDAGVRFVCRLLPSKKNPKGVFQHEVADSFDQLMAVATKWARTSDKVYYACAAYKEATWKEYTKDDGSIRRYPTRGRDNGKILAVRSMWEDVDVGKADPAKCYPTAKEAIVAVFDACKVIGLPTPLVVHSGKGVHVYWPFTEDVTYDQWVMLAELKKSAFLHAGLRIDTSRAADIKSVLRPIGVPGSGGNPVRMLRDAGPFSYQDLFDTLSRYTAVNTVAVHQPRVSVADVNDELGSVEYPPSSAYRIADNCGQVAHFRDTMGDVGYDLWWINIGLLKHTIENDEVIHAWSSGHPGYSFDETQSKIDDWSYGPSTCAKLMSCNPNGCDDCQYQGKVKSPIQLGYAEDKPAINEPPTKVQTTPTTAERALPKSFAEVEFPPGFGINAAGMLTEGVVDANGVVQHVPIASRPFFIQEHILNHDYTRTYRVVYKGANGRWRDFNLDAADMADVRAFSKAFYGHEIFMFGKEGVAGSMRMIRDLANSNKGVETRQVRHMGWMYSEDGNLEDAFVIGKNVITKDSVHPVRADDGLTSAISALGDGFTSKGSRSVWLDLVNRVYHRPGAEGHQLVILAGFAAPLIEFTKTGLWHGIPIALTGGTSAGKSTVCEVMSSIYGQRKALFMVGGQGGSSFMAAAQIPGLVCNLPIAFDDMSERKPEEVRDLLYQLPQGKEKVVMTANRTMRRSDLYWNTLEIITSNVDFYTMLARFGGNVKDATQVRIFEVRMRDNLALELWPDVNVKTDVDPVLNDNHGVVGRDWVRFIMANREKICTMLTKTQARLTPQSSGMESAERFYADMMAAVIVAGKLLTKALGWLHFDMVAFEKWMLSVIEDNRSRRVDTGHTTQDKITSLLRFHHDAILHTRHFPVFARGTNFAVEAGYVRPRRGTLVRIAVDDKRLFVAADALDEWCAKHNVNKHGFINDMLAEGFLKATVDLSRRKSPASPCRVNLGKGTAEPTGSVRCYEVEYEMVFEDSHALEKVISIEAHKDVGNA